MHFPPLPDPIERCQTVDGITAFCDESLARAATIANTLRALKDAPDSALTWEATFGAFDALTHAVQESVCVPSLFQVAHPDAAVRTAASGCEPKADAFLTALLVDDAVASVLKRAAQMLGTQTDPVRARLIEHVLRDYRRNGLDLDATGRERQRVLNEEITRTGQQFERNLAESTLFIEIKPEQLAGMPDAYIAAHPPGANGLVRITTDYPDFVPFLRYATDRIAARDLYIQSHNRAFPQNLALLETLLRLRREKAALLGYPTWADYVLEPRMAKNAATVATFMAELHAGLKPKREEEFAILRAEAERAGLLEDGNVRVSDAGYLEDRVCQNAYALDSQKLSEYFEMSAVERGIMEITAEIYGVTFRPANAPTWHPDARPFDVVDADGSVLGRAYLDLYPREGKYKHAAVFGLRETVRPPDGSRLLPIGALVCNFPQPGAAPALLSHQDVITFFHEFGHLLHHLFSKSEFARFAGTGVARDFVEAPSQMFEEWAWRRDTLDRFARHYQTGERLPDDLFHALTTSRTFGEAIHNERQLFLAAVDHAYHTRAELSDTDAVVNELHPEYSSFTRLPGTHFQSTFGHLVGYDAAYYGYQWARSLAFDLFTRFDTEGLLNATTAREYRAAILESGGSREETDLVKTFLGRPASADAYKRFLGI